MRLPMPIAVCWTAILGFADRMGIEISGYMAFTVMLALFPFLIFLVSVAGFLGGSEIGDQFMRTLSLFAPPDVTNTLRPALDQVIAKRDSSLLTIGLVLALYSAGSGVAALRLALNLSYQAAETRPFWLRKLLDFAVVVVGSIVAILSSAAIILGPWIWKVVNWFFPVDPTDQHLWHVGRYVFTILLMAAGVTALHRVLPNVKLLFRQILPGAVTTTVLWVIAATALTLYFGKYANYDSTYGSLGGVIITLMFFYISGIIFIFGGELNAALLARASKARARHNSEREIEPSPANP